MAPFLFIIVIDYVLKNAELEHSANGMAGFVTKGRASSRFPQESVFDLDFVDDIALFERILDNAQSQLSTTAKLAREVGLEVNIKKTEAFTNQQHIGLNVPIDQHK